MSDTMNIRLSTLLLFMLYHFIHIGCDPAAGRTAGSHQNPHGHTSAPTQQPAQPVAAFCCRSADPQIKTDAPLSQDAGIQQESCRPAF